MIARRVVLPIVVLAAGILASCGGGAGGETPLAPGLQPPLPQTYRPSGLGASGAAFVHLFEWRWSDIARECEVWLGPKGYRGVQISPPSEHAVLAAAGYPWWQRYQTVSYKLDRSRSGTRAEFIDMVDRCRAAGVDIYADVVINHMTGTDNGVGSAGSAFTKYNYAAVPYGPADFHTPCAVTNYRDQANVQQCELVGLADLRTEQEAVRARIADYLTALHALGVAGYRIDAAKHMHARDIDAVLARVHAAAEAAGRPRPYVFLEVINNAGEAVGANDYFGVGYASGGASDITEFQYGYRVTDAFTGRNGATLAGLATLTDGLMPADKAVVFTDNHDNQRGANISYQDADYELAAIYTLAQPYGVVSLMSSYGFDRTTAAGRDAGPPGANGITLPVYADAPAAVSRCTAQLGSAQPGSWICEHRRPAIANMVAFRRVTAGLPTAAWQQIGTANQIAFARKNPAVAHGAGFVALNRESAARSAVVLTTLPSGRYCDIVSGSFVPGTGTAPAACTGAEVTVAGDGSATVSVPAHGAVALHVGAQPG